MEAELRRDRQRSGAAAASSAPASSRRSPTPTRATPNLVNLLLDPYFNEQIQKGQANWRQIVAPGRRRTASPRPAFMSRAGVLRRLPRRPPAREPAAGPARLLRRAHLRAHRPAARPLLPHRLARTRPPAARHPARGEGKSRRRAADGQEGLGEGGGEEGRVPLPIAYCPLEIRRARGGGREISGDDIVRHRSAAPGSCCRDMSPSSSDRRSSSTTPSCDELRLAGTMPELPHESPPDECDRASTSSARAPAHRTEKSNVRRCISAQPRLPPMAMGNGQWAMGNGQWAMGNGQFTARTTPSSYTHSADRS